MASSIGTREPESGELDRRITIRLREDLPVEDADLDAVFTQPRHRWAKIRAVGTAVYTDSVQTDDTSHIGCGFDCWAASRPRMRWWRAA
ncbi:hypothetical protein PSN_2896 [Pseudomonas sp. NGC7]